MQKFVILQICLKFKIWSFLCLLLYQSLIVQLSSFNKSKIPPVPAKGWYDRESRNKKKYMLSLQRGNENFLIFRICPYWTTHFLFTIKYVSILRMTLTGIRSVTVKNVCDDTVPLYHVAWLRDPISSVFCNIPSLSNLRKHQTRNIAYCSSLQVDKTKSSTKPILKVESNTYSTSSHVKCIHVTTSQWLSILINQSISPINYNIPTPE